MNWVFLWVKSELRSTCKCRCGNVWVWISARNCTGKCAGFGGMFASSSCRLWFVPAGLMNACGSLVWVSSYQRWMFVTSWYGWVPAKNVHCVVCEWVYETGRSACSFPVKVFIWHASINCMTHWVLVVKRFFYFVSRWAQRLSDQGLIQRNEMNKYDSVDISVFFFVLNDFAPYT